MAAIVDMDGVGGKEAPQGWDASKFVPLTGPIADAVTEAFWRRAPFARLVKELSGCFGGFNGMGKVTLEWETVKESEDDPLSDTSLKPVDTPMGTYQLESMPLPITHSDPGRVIDGVFVPVRREDIDLNNREHWYGIEASSRRCGEAVEGTFLGTREPFGYAGSKVYGVLTYPNRQTVTHEAFPDTFPEHQQSRLKLITQMIAFQQRNKFYGPWLMLHGQDWNAPLDQDFDEKYETLRAAVKDLAPTKVWDEELQKMVPGKGEPYLRGIHFVQDPEWPADAVALVQMTPEVIQMVEGLPVGVFPWGDGYKVATITVSRIRSDYEGRCGICVARSHDAEPQAAVYRNATVLPKSEWIGTPVVYEEADTPVIR